MTDPIRVAIAGYGNLGRGVEAALKQNPDMRLVGVFSRRDPASVALLDASVPVYAMADVEQYQDAVDVMILCGGSKTDLPEQGPYLAQFFNTVDSFDTHAKVNQHHEALDQSAQKSGHVAMLSGGWDPGLFSLNRLFGETILPEGETYTFWGKGLSQGHSDAVRRVPGVKRGVQYTLPSEDAIARVRSGEQPTLSTREKHKGGAKWCLMDMPMEATGGKVLSTMQINSVDLKTRLTSLMKPPLGKRKAACPNAALVSVAA